MTYGQKSYKEKVNKMDKEEQFDEIIANNSGDVWKQIASKENNIPYEEVSKNQRDAAKSAYFSMMYGRLR